MTESHNIFRLDTIKTEKMPRVFITQRGLKNHFLATVEASILCYCSNILLTTIQMVSRASDMDENVATEKAIKNFFIQDKVIISAQEFTHTMIQNCYIKRGEIHEFISVVEGYKPLIVELYKEWLTIGDPTAGFGRYFLKEEKAVNE